MSRDPKSVVDLYSDVQDDTQKTRQYEEELEQYEPVTRLASDLEYYQGYSDNPDTNDNAIHLGFCLSVSIHPQRLVATNTMSRQKNVQTIRCPMISVAS